MKKYIIFIIFLLFFIFIFSGCAPSKFEPYNPPKIEFEKSEKYNPDFKDLEKPEAPEFIYLDDEFNIIEKEEDASYVALDNNEIKKIQILNELYNSQEDIINEQVNLVNIKIEQINTLKELISMKEQQINTYVSLYADERNKYLQERYDRKVESFIHKTFMYSITIGSIIILAL